MNYVYIAELLENVAGGSRVMESKRFDNLDECVEWTKQQKDGHFSWWQVRVEW